MFEQHVLELENLLESYLMMLDGTLAKLAGGYRHTGIWRFCCYILCYDSGVELRCCWGSICLKAVGDVLESYLMMVDSFFCKAGS
jgi:hypothetical protein